MFKTGDQSLVSFVLYAVMGIVLGTAVNRVATFVDKPPLSLTEKNVYLSILVKLVVMVGVLFFIQQSAPAFAWDWQNTTPGLCFVFFYFTLQIMPVSQIVSQSLKVLV